MFEGIMKYLINNMKSTKYIIILVCLIIPMEIFAQPNQAEQMVVKLSNPNQPGYLNMKHNKGSISISGYDGDAVIVKAVQRFPQDGGKSIKGAKNLTGIFQKIKVIEEENTFIIKTESIDKTIDFDIKIPYRFSLNLSIKDNGKIIIRNINGEIEANNPEGDIRLINVSGSAVISSINGNIFGTFNKITPDIPMAFSTIEGKIDIFFPSDIKASFKVKSKNGEVYSNFNFYDKKVNSEINGRSGLKIISPQTSGLDKVNGGGAEIMMKTINGDIYLRSMHN
jgi:DUF4097 and DUF4098 domain-containing protein YvlB